MSKSKGQAKINGEIDTTAGYELQFDTYIDILYA